MVHCPVDLMSYPKAEVQKEAREVARRLAMLSKANSTHTEGLEDVDICTSAFFSW